MEWISVKDRLPTGKETVLLFCDCGSGETYKALGWYMEESRIWVIDGFPYRFVTHWMPLPPPPFSDGWIVRDYTPDVDRPEPSKFAQKRDIRYECPECGMESKQKTKFCPHCGGMNIVD